MYLSPKVEKNGFISNLKFLCIWQFFSNALTPSEVNQKLGHTCVANETASLPNSNPLSFANFFVLVTLVVFAVVVVVEA